MFPQMMYALALATLALAAHAADNSHRKEDAGKHRQIAKAHEAAAACVRAGSKTDNCLANLLADCKAIAIGKLCGLRRQAHEHQSVSDHAAEHARMAAVHGEAAACMESATPYKECLAQLDKACGKLGVGKYCGMRHAH